MKIYEGFHEFEKVKNPVVTSGTFDGVHIGHQKILTRVKQIADRENGEVVLITFWPHPRLVLSPEKELFLINTFEEKAELLKKFGVDHLIKIPFTKEFSKLSSFDFVKKVLMEQIGTHILVIGYDHRFGRNREGGFEYLKENSAKFKFKVEEIPKEDVDNMTVSSTEVRKAINSGDVALASTLMGHFYTITGTVGHGDKIGQKIGFPTANIFVNSPNKIIPADGVYAVKVNVKNRDLQGMLYIGNRPTINGTKKNIEVNIFGFNEDIYQEEIRVTFIHQTRGDMKFESLEKLSEKLAEDKTETLKILSDHENQH